MHGTFLTQDADHLRDTHVAQSDNKQKLFPADLSTPTLSTHMFHICLGDVSISSGLHAFWTLALLFGTCTCFFEAGRLMWMFFLFGFCLVARKIARLADVFPGPAGVDFCGPG